VTRRAAPPIEPTIAGTIGMRLFDEDGVGVGDDPPPVGDEVSPVVLNV
jgi:hypothetical protein